MEEVKLILEKLYNSFNPVSIFLYGSMATGTNTVDSDYEIGIVFDETNYVSRRELKLFVGNAKISIYPFRKNELLNGTIDTPLQKTVYINSLIKSGKTLFGEKIIENMEAPVITTLDLLLDTRFNLGYAFAAFRNYRDGDSELAKDLFYKSCLFATRNLIYTRTKLLEVSFNGIFEKSKDIEIDDEYREVINAAFNFRKGNIDSIEENLYYKNLSYINKLVESELLEKNNQY